MNWNGKSKMSDNDAMQIGMGFFNSAQYDRVREPYAAELAALIDRHFRVDHHLVCAEFGAGSGNFPRELLRSSLPLQKLYLVEPDRNALARHQERFAKDPRFSMFEYIQAFSGNSSLPDRSLDGIFAAQCFHWFPLAETKAEFMRILKLGAKAFITGRFPVPENRQTEEFIALTSFGKRLYGRKSNREAYSAETMEGFFGQEILKQVICREFNRQSLDTLLAEMQIRIDSSGSDDVAAWGAAILQQTRDFFERNQNRGVVALVEETVCFVGEMV